jgi:hypothetical protein
LRSLKRSRVLKRPRSFSSESSQLNCRKHNCRKSTACLGRESIQSTIGVPVSPSTAVECYPCRRVSLNYSDSHLFHGGNTSSNLVRDAGNLSKAGRRTKRYLVMFTLTKNGKTDGVLPRKKKPWTNCNRCKQITQFPNDRYLLSCVFPIRQQVQNRTVSIRLFLLDGQLVNGGLALTSRVLGQGPPPAALVRPQRSCCLRRQRENLSQVSFRFTLISGPEERFSFQELGDRIGRAIIRIDIIGGEAVG